MVGASLSSTITFIVPVVLFPASSCAVKVTTVVPNPNVVPEAMSEFRVDMPQLSVAAGSLNVTTASQVPGSVETVMSEMAGMKGFSVSFTVTSKLLLTELPDGSVAV